MLHHLLINTVLAVQPHSTGTGNIKKFGISPRPVKTIIQQRCQANITATTPQQRLIRLPAHRVQHMRPRQIAVSKVNTAIAY